MKQDAPIIIETNDESLENDLEERKLSFFSNTSPRKLSEQEQMVLRKTPSMDLLKRSPYLLLRLLACMKPIPSLDNYPREKQLIENIIETVKQEEEVNAEFISELGNSLSKLDSDCQISQEEMNTGKLVEENNNVKTESSTTTNNIINNIIIINNNNNNNNNVINNNNSNNNSSSDTTNKEPNKKINLIEELNLIALKNANNNNKVNTNSCLASTSSIMNDISIQNPNNLINSIILKNFESHNTYNKVPHYVTTIVPNNKDDNDNNNNNSQINKEPNTQNSTTINSTIDNSSPKTTATTTISKIAKTNTEPLIKPIDRTTTEPLIKPMDRTITEPLIKPIDRTTTEPIIKPIKKHLDLDIDLSQNIATAKRFDHTPSSLGNANTIQKNPGIVQKVNMNFTIKKDSLHTKKFVPNLKSEESSLSTGKKKNKIIQYI